MLRRVASLLAVVVLVAPAAAHDPVSVIVLSPQRGATVSGERVKVSLLGGPGTAVATFRLALDGVPVDVSGTVSRESSFLTHRLAPRERRTLMVPLAGYGEHELRLIYDRDVDSQRPDFVQPFTSRPARSGPPLVPIVGGVLAVAAVGVAVGARRRAARAAPRNRAASRRATRR